MNRLNIIIGVSAFTIISFGAYLFFNRKNRSLNVNDINIKDVPQSTKDDIRIDSRFDSVNEIKLLKEDISKAYYVMEILKNDNGTLINTITGNPVADGLDVATKNSLESKLIEVTNNLNASNISSSAKNYGRTLILDLKNKVNKLFQGI